MTPAIKFLAVAANEANANREKHALDPFVGKHESNWSLGETRSIGQGFRKMNGGKTAMAIYHVPVTLYASLAVQAKDEEAAADIASAMNDIYVWHFLLDYAYRHSLRCCQMFKL